MSYSFSVTYNNVTKRVFCTPNCSILNLVLLSIEKFRVPESITVSLFHDGKRLDDMLSIRLANLRNNAKLELQTVRLVEMVNLKISGKFLFKQLSKVVRVSPSVSVACLVSEFLQQCGETADWTQYNVELSAMQHTIKNNSTDFSTTLVKSLIGSSEKAVLRLTIEDAAKIKKREDSQKESDELRKSLDRQRHAVCIAGREQIEKKNALLEERMAIEETSQPTEEERKKNLYGELAEPELNSSEPYLFSQASADAEVCSLPIFNKSPPSIVESRGKTISAPWLPPTETEDTLYAPKNQIIRYENPDDDYNVTTNQSEIYLKMLQGMQKPSRKTKPTALRSYVIRVRFPDRKLLDLILKDSSVPLGQLFKKLDSYVHPKFANSYTLKNGSPPFQAIEMGFTENNISLKDHPQFQEERLLLVWEPTIKLPGPYLKEVLPLKDLSEMPNIALESHRKILQDDFETIRGTESKIVKTKTEKKPGVPKWFRP